MAETIPRNLILIPGRYLIEEDSPGSCMGTIVQEPGTSYGAFLNGFSLNKTFPNPEYDPEDPQSPPTITLKYTKIVFKREHAQEVKISGTDYLLIHSDSILAFLPPE